MKKQHWMFAAALGLGLMIPMLSGFAQSDKYMPSFKNRGALYYLGEQDELLIKVNIWGFVERPGQYMVPTGTDLISLISFAGGPREQAKLKKVKLIRNSNLLASRLESSKRYLAMNGNLGVEAEDSDNAQAARNLQDLKGQPTVIEVNVKKFLETGDQSLNPELKPGDTVVIEGTTFHFVSKVFEFTTKLAVIAQIYFWIYAARR